MSHPTSSGSPKVAVVGAGVIGCGIALRLAQGGAAVTLLDQAEPGAEASSAAAGMIAPQLEECAEGPFFELLIKSRAMYPEFVAEVERLSGLCVDYVRCGALRVALDDSEAAAIEEVASRQRAAGLRAELLSKAQALALEPSLSQRIRAAVNLPDEHHVENRRLVRALAIAAARAGANFRDKRVQRIALRGSVAVGVETADQLVEADAVVVAAGAWSSLLQDSGLKPDAVKPMRGQMVQLDSGAALLRKSIVGQAGYLVQRSDGRLLLGSTYELTGFAKRNTAAATAKILEAAIQLCPGIAELPVTACWAGLRPYTDDHWPILGPGPISGVFLATGHLRNGILLAPITARLISQAVLQGSPSVDLDPFRYERSSPATARPSK